MNRFVLIPAAFLALLVGAACEDKTAPVPPSGTTSPAPVVLSDQDLAVPADYEEEAESSITVASYKAELDALASEVE